MKRNTNDFHEREDDDETKRPRSLSAASLSEAQQANHEWLLANQQRLQAQSEALAAMASGQSVVPDGGQQPNARLAAFESAQNQWAAALIRQRQAEETLLQCQQQQAAAAAEYLQQQAVAAINHQQQGLAAGAQEAGSHAIQASLLHGIGEASSQGNVDPIGGVFNTQPAISSLPGMFGTDERIYPRLPMEGFASGNEATPPAGAVLGSGVDFNVQSLGPGYPSLLLSSTPVPLSSHLAPVQPAGVAMPQKHEQPKPKKAKKVATPKVSIAGPKRRPVSLQSLVNRGEVCYDPGPVRELALPSDQGNLSEYQCLLRKQIILFAVSINDIQCSAQGRNKPIVLGQVGVLCRHCARIPPGMRPCGASYFPGKLSGLYQAAQNMAINHLSKSCRSIDEDTKETLIKLKAQKSTVLGGGKNFWANGARVLGVVEVEEGHLRFKDG